MAISSKISWKKKHKKILKKASGYYGARADLSKQLNKQILNHFNMHLGTGKQKKKL